MQLSSPPTRIPVPFAISGLKNTIPLTTAGITTPGQASFDVGFPALTMQPTTSGGIPPQGQDFNGVLYALSAVARWSCAGGVYGYNSTFANNSNVGGYPKLAILAKSAGTGYWVNTLDGNTTDPDASGAGWSDLLAFLTAGGSSATGGSTNTYSSSTVLTYGTDVGNLILVAGAGGTMTLPLANTTAVGNNEIAFAVQGGSAVITAPAGNTITLGSQTGLASFTMTGADWCIVKAISSTVWVVKLGTPLLAKSNAFLAGRQGFTKQISVGWSSGSTVNNVLSFTAPCDGKVMAISSVSINTNSQNLTGALSINGTQYGYSFIATTMVDMGVASVTANTTVTIVQAVTAGSTPPSSLADMQLAYVFVPAQ
jgi:hypothetical protein